MMSASKHTESPTTEITLVSGECHWVEGHAKAVEQAILDAARGSIMQLAWFVHAETRDELAVNPKHVVALRSARRRDSD